MNKVLLALAGSALAASFITATPVQAEMTAGPFDKIKKKVKKAKKAAEEAEAVVDEVEAARRTNGRSVVNRVIGASSGDSATTIQSDGGGGNSGCYVGTTAGANYPCTARAPDHAGNAGPAPTKYADMNKCADVGLGNAFVGRAGNYSFSQGIATEERTGLLARRPVTPVNGCIYEGLGIGDVLYVEFDKNKYQKFAYNIQCVSFDGSEQQDNVFGPKIGNYTGKAIMLHSGNSTGYTPTASGSNSDRSGAYDKYMDKRGRTFTTFNFEALHTDKSGTDFFCQWFDKKTGESALALTYRRGPAG